MYCLHLQSQRASRAKQSARSTWQRELAAFSNLWTLHRVDSLQSTTYAEFEFLVTINWTVSSTYSSTLKMKTVQILCFWTLSIFIYKRCPIYFSKYNISETRFCLSLKNNRTVLFNKDRTWIMSKNIIFGLMYHHHELLDPMKAVLFSGASVNLYHTKRCHFPEESALSLNSFDGEFLPWELKYCLYIQFSVTEGNYWGKHLSYS
jgi:hypothetical protein